MDETSQVQQNEMPGKSRANRYLIIIMLVTPILVLPLVFAILLLFPSKKSAYTKFYLDKEKLTYIEIPAGWSLDYSSVTANQLPRTVGVGNDLTINHEVKLISDKNDSIVISQSLSSSFTGGPVESCYSASKDEVIIKEPGDQNSTGAVRRQLDGTYSYSLLYSGCEDQPGSKYHLIGGGDGVVAPYFTYKGARPAEADDIFIRNFTRSNPVQLFTSMRN